jgi:hypothetical protein
MKRTVNLLGDFDADTDSDTDADGSSPPMTNDQ